MPENTKEEQKLPESKQTSQYLDTNWKNVEYGRYGM
jgi:hypothetical protein